MTTPHRFEDEWRAALSALLDGEEPAVEVSDLMVHLGECAECSTWLDHAAEVNSGLRTLPIVQPPLGERVVNRVDVQLCGCHIGQACLCADCQCGPWCTCHSPAGAPT
ncbi:MAG: zf-HC2 domain-containing protein [Micropruina sp.]|nr:MAG: zf-HC2 domain-containing protein [Micropruina sp.]